MVNKIKNKIRIEILIPIIMALIVLILDLSEIHFKITLKYIFNKLEFILLLLTVIVFCLFIIFNLLDNYNANYVNDIKIYLRKHGVGIGKTDLTEADKFIWMIIKHGSIIFIIILNILFINISNYYDYKLTIINIYYESIVTKIVIIFCLLMILLSYIFKKMGLFTKY